MKRILLLSLLAACSLAAICMAQSGTAIPDNGAGRATQPSCVILKRMGPADQVTSHLYSFGIRGKQFQYVEGKLPDGYPFHGRMTDHDVRNLQSRGTEVVVLESKYTTDELKQARADCKGETGKSLNQAEAQAAPPADAAPVTVDPPAAAPAPPPPADSAPVPAPASASGGRLSVVSNPDGADIEIDGTFVGNTPSDLQVPEGDHIITVKKAGFKEWQRKMKVTGGSSVRLNATLSPS